MSSLSITEWRPVTGSVPPTSQADWESEFDKYRVSPEYARLNPNMTLDEFKKIYFMEWTHRLWGRVIGVTFVLPAAYFIARRRVCRRTALAVVGISGLIGFQVNSEPFRYHDSADSDTAISAMGRLTVVHPGPGGPLHDGNGFDPRRRRR